MRYTKQFLRRVKENNCRVANSFTTFVDLRGRVYKMILKLCENDKEKLEFWTSPLAAEKRIHK